MFSRKALQLQNFSLCLEKFLSIYNKKQHTLAEIIYNPQITHTEQKPKFCVCFLREVLLQTNVSNSTVIIDKDRDNRPNQCMPNFNFYYSNGKINDNPKTPPLKHKVAFLIRNVSAKKNKLYIYLFI